MKLKEFRVREFKSIWDSGPIKVDDQVTCLVGKNEAGKTALLTALYRTNPIITENAIFDETYDYPKREVEDYHFAVENKERDEAVVVECKYELELDDLTAITSVFGEKVVKGNTFNRKIYYGKSKHRFCFTSDDSAARTHLAENAGLTDELKTALKGAADWDGFAAALDAAEATEAATKLKELVTKVRERGLAHYILNSLIWPCAPKFLYFDEYYQMKGETNLNALIAREDAKQLEESDYPLLGLINLARLNHKQLVQTKNTTELKKQTRRCRKLPDPAYREVLVAKPTHPDAIRCSGRQTRRPRGHA
jgi:hypothetical protein